ncbi:preprotein translocase subunit SecY [Escherichia coli]|nr:preprotein translocase subunit SecY [Escherichia coli]
MTWKYNALILLNKKHALGRSLVIFKNSVSRS